MVKEAEQYTEQDRLKKEEVEARNNADSTIYTAEKTKQDLKDKLSQDNVAKIDQGINAVKEALKGKDVAAIKAKTEELGKILQEVGSAVYQQQAQQQAQQQQAQQQAQQAQQTAQPPPEGEKKVGKKVVDAEYEEVDKDK